MKIYLASSFLNKHNARQAMNALEDAGHEITGDWTKHQFTAELGVLEKEAVEDLEALKRADVFIMLWPGRNGTNAELGIAIALQKLIVFVGGVPRHESVYFNFPGIEHLGTIDDAIEFLDGWQRRLYSVE